LKFIFADCLDYIDPNYDFLRDSYSQSRKPYWNDTFPHEFMDTPPYDGILVSRAIVGDHLFSGKYTEAQAMRFRREGARKFLRYPEKEYPGSLLIGDCGAFQYHRMEKPPFSPEDMIDFYIDGAFTHGCSVDHIIFQYDTKYDHGVEVPLDLIRRREITLENAQIFKKLSLNIGHGFTPLGVVQAWSPKSMADTALELVKMGYDYLALGGLVPLRVQAIKEILQNIYDKIPRNVRIHILGFAKANLLDQFRCFNIASFDTTSPFIQAFKDSKRNYWSLKSPQDIDFYVAIRIPQAYENNKIKSFVKSGRLSQEKVCAMESKTLSLIRGYASGKISLEESFNSILDYTRDVVLIDDDRLESKLQNLANDYYRTLSEKPWEQCSCRVCREIGVEAVIFRASNRNKRRGFHNLHVFNEYVQNINQQGFK
jgi:hypothetical protein